MKFIVIDDSEPFGMSLKYALPDKEVICLEPTEALEKIRESDEMLLINANLKFDENNKRINCKGAVLARELRYDQTLSLESPIIIISFESQERVERRINFYLSKDEGFYYLKAPFSLKEFEDVIKGTKKITLCEDERTQGIKRANLNKAIDIIRNIGHEIKGATIGFVQILREVIGYKGSEESVERLISIARRDEGKERSWVDWFREEIYSLPDKLYLLGFDYKEEFPKDMDKIKRLMMVIDDYLRYFHLNEEKEKISQEDRKMMVGEAENMNNYFKELQSVFNSMEKSLKERYL